MTLHDGHSRRSCTNSPSRLSANEPVRPATTTPEPTLSARDRPLDDAMTADDTMPTASAPPSDASDPLTVTPPDVPAGTARPDSASRGTRREPEPSSVAQVSAAAAASAPAANAVPITRSTLPPANAPIAATGAVRQHLSFIAPATVRVDPAVIPRPGHRARRHEECAKDNHSGPGTTGRNRRSDPGRRQRTAPIQRVCAPASHTDNRRNDGSCQQSRCHYRGFTRGRWRTTNSSSRISKVHPATIAIAGELISE